MALQKQTVDFPIVAGVDTDTAEKLTQGYLQMDNVRLTATGQAQKRYGFTALSDVIEQDDDGYNRTFDYVYGGYSDNHSNALVHALTETATRKVDSLLRLNEYSGDWQRVKDGPFPYEIGSKTLLNLGEGAPVQSCMSAVSNYFFYSFITSENSVVVVIVDNSTKSILRSIVVPATVTTAYSIKSFYDVYSANFILLVGTSATTVEAFYTEVPYSGAQAGNLDGLSFSTLTVTGAIAGGIWDACAYFPNSKGGFVIAYIDAANEMYLHRYIITGSTGAYTLTDYNAVKITDAASTPTAKNAISVTNLIANLPAGNKYYAQVFYQSNTTSHIHHTLWFNEGGVWTKGIDTVAAIDKLTANCRNITAYPDEDNTDYLYSKPGSRVFAEYAGATASDAQVVTALALYDGTDITGAAADQPSFYGLGLASKAFPGTSTPLVLLVNGTATQPTFFIASLVIINSTIGATGYYRQIYGAKLLPFEASGFVAANSLSDVYSSGGDFRFVGLRQARLASDGVVSYNGIGIDATYINRLPSIVADGQLTIGGGVLLRYDGVNAIEQAGHHIYPSDISAVAAGSGGSMSDGTYSIVAVYEYTDAKGNIYRSQPSTAISVTLSAGGSSQKITVTIPNVFCNDTDLYQDASSGAEPRLHLYRTADAGTVYYKETADNSRIDNNLASYTIVLSTDDSNIADNEILYTDGGVLGNDTPPSAFDIAIAQNRMYVVQADDRQKIWFSKQKIAGIGWQFNAALTKRVVSGGDITGIEELDGKIIVFKAGEIRYFYGDGPNEFNQGSFSQDVQISNNVGCISRDSIIKTPQGIMFQSRRGIYLLDRSLQVSPVGESIDEYVIGSTIVGARMLPNEHQVRFVINLNRTSLTTGNNIEVVYDYRNQRWYRNTYASKIISSFVYNNIYHMTYSDESIQEESTGFDSDVQMTIKTPWYKVGMAKMQRIYRALFLGDWRSSHTINIDVHYDYSDTKTKTESKAITSDPAPYDLVLRPEKQKCRAIQFVVYDTDRAGTYESFALDAISLELGTKKGVGKVGTGKRI